MNIITEPTVIVKSIPQFLEDGIAFKPSGKIDLVDPFEIPLDGDDNSKLASYGAKGCYDSNGKNGRPNIENNQAVLESRHGSVLEHVNISLHVSGVTRALTLELNRHRGLAISQRSTRYTKEEDASIVLEPFYAKLYNLYKNGFSIINGKIKQNDDFIEDPSLFPEYNFICDHLDNILQGFKRYREEIEILTKWNPENLSGFDLRKYARGKARNLLPHSLETRALYTANIRTWRWIIESRSDRHAEAEIRRLAATIYHALSHYAPIFFKDFEITGEFQDIPEYKPKYSKV